MKIYDTEIKTKGCKSPIKTNEMTTTIQYNKKQLTIANTKLKPKGLKLVVDGKGLKCVIIYSVDNLDLFNDQETANLISHVNKDIMNLGFISSYSISLH